MAETPHLEALPNYKQAVIPTDKLVKYCLNPEHSVGKHKARVFESALGFDQSNWFLLEERIREQLPFFPATKEEEDEHGKRYNVFVDITGTNGQVASVLTAWIIKPENDYPSLTTAYVKNRS